jgi:uncharacterized membrane protein
MVRKKSAGKSAKGIRENLPDEKKTVRQQSSSSMVAGKVQQNIEKILQMEKEAEGGRSPVEHLADRITFFAGSTPFIVIHIIWFGVWILINGKVIPGIMPFDKFPFSFLTLVVSLEAIFLTLLVLMSQNRMTKEADKRAHIDLQVNMLDEQETTIILRTVQKIATHLGIEKELDESIQELCEETDVDKVAKTLDEQSRG